MYLSGPMNFRFPDGHIETLNPAAPMTWLADFLSRKGAAVRADGTPMSQTQILGGQLFDGCPANVILSDGQWLPEQLDAVRTNPAVLSAVRGCRYLPAEFGPQQTTVLQANNAPAALNTSDTISRTGAGPNAGTVYTPTGVSTPTIITVPGGSGYVDPPAPPAPTTEVQAAGFNLPLMLLLGGVAVFALSGKKGKRK